MPHYLLQEGTGVQDYERCREVLALMNLETRCRAAKAAVHSPEVQAVHSPEVDLAKPHVNFVNSPEAVHPAYAVPELEE